MTDAELTPLNLIPGEVYLMTSDNGVKWYVTNLSCIGSRVKSGFAISVNDGYNSENCYTGNNCQFYSHINDIHAYTNVKNPRFRHLTQDELRWFNHCRCMGKFIPYDKVIKKNEILRDFPDSGSIVGYDDELFKYLENSSREPTSGDPCKDPIGIAWNSRYYWVFSVASSKQQYAIEQLRPFLPKPHDVALYPLTPDECYPFPEKWCIECKEDTFKMLTEFLHEHNSEWRDYRKTWCVTPNHYYFHYPPVSPVGHSQDKPKEGYTLITTQQFKKHVLTHKQSINNLNNEKNEQQERECSGTSIKVQGSNLTVRDTGSIGATGIRCTKVKIQVRSGHLPN
jgi:hypothetical protein